MGVEQSLYLSKQSPFILFFSGGPKILEKVEIMFLDE